MKKLFSLVMILMFTFILIGCEKPEEVTNNNYTVNAENVLVEEYEKYDITRVDIENKKTSVMGKTYDLAYYETVVITNFYHYLLYDGQEKIIEIKKNAYIMYYYVTKNESIEIDVFMYNNNYYKIDSYHEKRIIARPISESGFGGIAWFVEETVLNLPMEKKYYVIKNDVYQFETNKNVFDKVELYAYETNTLILMEGEQ